MSRQDGLIKAEPDSGHSLNLSGHPATLSINFLPSEILVEIFHQVCGTFSTGNQLRRWYMSTQPCWNEPVILSHVCSHWRQIAIILGSFWSHIDLYEKADPARLETYVARSIENLLDVHINLSDSSTAEKTLDDIVLPFLTINAHRMRSLSADINGGYQFAEENICGLMFATCFEKCTPGVLTEVSIDALGYVDIHGGLDIVRARINEGKLTESAIESLWLPVTFLQTTCCQVDWGSKAYHGLTELRLHGPGAPSSYQLTYILQSSPRLRILELELHAFTPIDPPLHPVRLDYLETLVLTNTADNFVGPVLRLIAPGPKPLSLSIPNPYRYRQDRFGSFTGELKSFVARSNVTHLTVHRLKNSSEVAGVLSFTPAIRDLAIAYFEYNGTQNKTISPSHFTLDSLCVVGSSPSTWPGIEILVKTHHVQKLTLWEHDFKNRGLSRRGVEKLLEQLYTICPVVKVVPRSDPNPIEEFYPWN